MNFLSLTLWICPKAVRFCIVLNKKLLLFINIFKIDALVNYHIGKQEVADQVREKKFRNLNSDDQSKNVKSPKYPKTRLAKLHEWTQNILRVQATVIHVYNILTQVFGYEILFKTIFRLDL